MDEDRKAEIYADECGFSCPCGPGECPHQLDDGHICGLDEPWFDCDDFQTEYQYEISYAEQCIALEEEGDEND